jgi:hypothetical protein
MKRVTVLDEETFEHVNSVIKRAQWTGASIPVRLHHAGLLWTREREAHIRADAMAFLLNEMRNWAPHEFLRIVNRSLANCTPTDMYMAMCQWIQDHVDHARQST